MSGKMSAKEVRDKLDDDTLDLSLCDLEEVPVKEISILKRFSILDLSNNSLASLPKNFATLTQIIKLDLSKNLISELPENFGELRQLKHLDLYSNKISKLPLSLGELKNLKWLDLKENPLTPAVASVAGPCSNSNECQSCAKNIVNYLASVKISMEEEKLKRLTAAQEAEKIAATTKKENKKKKKAAEKKANEKDKANNTKKELSQEKNNLPKSSKVKSANNNRPKSKDSKGGVCSMLCRAFTSLIMWSAFFALFTITALAIFPIYDEQRSEEFFKYAETQTGIPLKYYHHEGIRLLETFMDSAKLWTNHTRGLIEKTYREYFVEQATTTSDKKEF